MAVEILLIKITYTKNLTGITFGCVEGRSKTFANDTTIYIERTPENLRNAVKYLKEFAFPLHGYLHRLRKEHYEMII